jgi:predicted XRE-type DNA-binding protein
MKRKTKSTKSSGNVFADLGLPNADEHLIKADIVIAIAERIKTKRLTQAEVSKLIGLAQSYCVDTSLAIRMSACSVS